MEASDVQFLDQLPVGVFILDRHGRPCYANQAAQALLGRGVATDVGLEGWPRPTGPAWPAPTRRTRSARMPVVQAMALHGLDGRFLEVNRGMCELTGRSGRVSSW